MGKLTDSRPRRVPGRRGRPPKSISDHILEGTYRPDRHGPPPPRLTEKPTVLDLPTNGVSKRWVRSVADERALANGCRFSEPLAEYVVKWFAKYLRLSEGGQWAGKPFELTDWERDEVVMPLFGWVRRSETGRIVRRYRKAYIHIPKKSGKSPFGAGIGTYMWAGDGEAGAKVFSAATEIQQAGIVHAHAINMVEDAPDLFANAKINRTTRSMVFKPTRSVYSVISGKASTFRQREGINAHCIIADELHAWQGFQLYESLKYAFASRMEPLFFQITTAGDNTDTVCFQQYEYSKGVISGEITDERHLGVIYEADPNADVLDEAEWDKANPSLGSIILKEDMRADAQEASKTPRDTATFKRYRLNIWCTAENPWLDANKWEACREDFTEDDLIGHDCWAGLDLAKTLDMTAFGMVFRDPIVDGVYRQLVRFWMPEETFEIRRHLAPYERWRDEGWLYLTPGGECDYQLVEQYIVEDHERFGFQRLYYDKFQAVGTAQRLETEHGIERVEFQPVITQYAEPTKEYERLVMQGNLRHNGNSLLAWQAGHVTTWEDRNQNIRPVKRKRGDHRTIDGIIVGVMALCGACGGPAPRSVYEDREGFVVV